MPARDDPSERFCIVDASDRPIGIATRAACHADRSLIHRSVHVAVTTPVGPLYARRGPYKDTGAGLWDLGCAGHVDAGETYEQTAVRELAEELGVTGAAPVRVGTFLLELPGETELCCVFRLHHDGAFRLAPPEVVALAVLLPEDPPPPLAPGASAVAAWLLSREAAAAGGPRDQRRP